MKPKKYDIVKELRKNKGCELCEKAANVIEAMRWTEYELIRSLHTAEELAEYYRGEDTGYF